jgi:nifR3 family TIM-barrel protein
MAVNARILGSELGSAGLTIGSHPVSGRAILAPMAGVTDRAMRRAAVAAGAAYAVSEMVATDSYARGEVEALLRSEAPGIGLHVVQIAGCDPHRMAEAARRVEAAGAAMIDINMGCPAKKVTGGLAGSALMRDLDHAIGLVRATVAAVRVPVSVKMRLGWDDASRNAPELARRAEAEGVALVSVHGRTRCQFYQGRADWAAIRAVTAAVSIPVVANGDCETADDARAMLAASGAAAVMIGRAAVGRPWLVGDIAHALATGRDRPPPTRAARHAVAQDHYESLLSRLGVAVGLRHARKHLAAYAAHAGIAPADPLRRRLVTSEDPAAVRAMLADVFDRPRLAEAA